MKTSTRCISLLAPLLITSACGSTGAGFHGGSGGDDGGASPMLDATTTFGDASAFTSPDGSSSGCTTCSADLHQVLDCATHQVIKTCPATAGCGAGGQCVAPCDGAAANKSSIGCEYYALNPDGYSDVPDYRVSDGSKAGGCFAAFVANTWTSPVSLHVDFNGQTRDVSKSAYLPQGSGASLSYAPLPGGVIPPNQMAILFLAHFHHAGSDGGISLFPSDGGPLSGDGPGAETPCPLGVTPAYTTDDAAIHGTGTGHAFHITTSAPVVAYDIYPYGGASSYISSATLLLPTSVWDTNYVAVTAYQGETYNSGKVDGNIAFVAEVDHTTITINPSAPIAGSSTVAGAPMGAPKTYALNQGEALQLEQFDDLTGSTVVSDKPIGMWGGHYAMFIPDTGTRAADAAHQQIPPIRALGSEYVAVRYRDRVGASGAGESVPWRILGIVDGTKLNYDPSAPPGAPSTLSRGQLVEFESPGPFVVASQDSTHPFYMAGHMTGGGNLPNYIGDPETVNLVPPQQFLSHYVFFTDPTYAETNLVVVRDKTLGKDVTLDCLTGPLTGWQPAGSHYEYTRIDVQHGGAKVGACDNGRHEMTSAVPFGVTVWGFDTAVSYAYPAGASVKPINSVVVPVIPQ